MKTLVVTLAMAFLSINAISQVMVKGEIKNAQSEVMITTNTKNIFGNWRVTNFYTSESDSFQINIRRHREVIVLFTEAETCYTKTLAIERGSIKPGAKNISINLDFDSGYSARLIKASKDQTELELIDTDFYIMDCESLNFLVK